MRAMVLRSPRTPLIEESRADPVPGPGQVRLRVLACAVCRTDLHVVDGDLPSHGPVVPGHEIVGIVEALGEGAVGPVPGERVGVPWLGRTCGHCAYCATGRENLCDTPQFTGWTRDGGFATHVVADAAWCVPLPPAARIGGSLDEAHLAPLLCAGLIGWRSFRMAGDDVRDLGLVHAVHADTAGYRRSTAVPARLARHSVSNSGLSTVSTGSSTASQRPKPRLSRPICGLAGNCCG